MFVCTGLPRSETAVCRSMLARCRNIQTPYEHLPRFASGELGRMLSVDDHARAVRGLLSNDKTVVNYRVGDVGREGI
ncbi:Uncharacterised protein [Mycobacterium xenopi]|uniref:Uncharacterized protein n=1 Tax=Mycobacterium xenopi TaxID=1789 RepID=A0AAD1H121_MYCXE|nr:hypothetical protein MYXE_23010 [Mycobacterium xenopi]SPX78386.1 Uncharacterised protein [Mycobacterium xenopi]